MVCMSFTPYLSEDISVVFLCGATASGKSALAHSLAEKYNGIIINADALQIYQELSIITARPTANEMAHIPHFLYGFLPISQNYNVVQWCQAVHDLLIAHSDRKIFIVGGTGLYIKSLIQGVAKIPEIQQHIRQEARALDNNALYHALLALDPIATEKLHKNDTQRLARAYEVVKQTGQSIYDWQNQSVSYVPNHIKWQGYFLNPSRDILYKRIHQRFDQMMDDGALNEVKNIMHYAPHYQGMKAVGVPELMAYLNNKISRSEAIEKAKQVSRNYAKRQITFFKNQFSNFTEIK